MVVTGSTGLLGSKIAGNSMLDVYPKNKKVDITTADIYTFIETINPDVVIHCAAFTNVDQCEIEKEKAWNINVKGTENVVDACETCDVMLVYVSTDFVFDGTTGMYTENDDPNPLNWYGKTKLEGEQRVEEMPHSIIARSSVLYGWHAKLNFVTWVMTQLKEKNNIQIVTDQYTCPSLADNVADVLVDLCEKEVQGLYHVTGSERINRYDFALKIAHKFDLDETLITPIETRELNQKAERPKDSSLSIEKVKSITDINLLSIDEGLTWMKEHHDVRT